MAADEFTRGDMDASAQTRTYESIMAFSVGIGVPACLGVTAMVTSLLMKSGLVPAFFFFFVVFFAVRFIGKNFFTH